MIPAREELPDLVRWATRIALVLASLRRHRHRKDDAIEAAMYALHCALRTYDPATETPFKEFAKWRIRGEVLDLIKSNEKRACREVPYDDAFVALSEGVLRDPDALARATGVESFVVRCGAEDPRENPEARLLQREKYALFHRELARCSPEAQQLYDLRHRQGLPWKDVARTLGLAVRTVQDHDQKLQKHLKDALLAEAPRRAGTARART